MLRPWYEKRLTSICDETNVRTLFHTLNHIYIIKHPTCGHLGTHGIKTFGSVWHVCNARRMSSGAEKNVSSAVSEIRESLTLFIFLFIYFIYLITVWFYTKTLIIYLTECVIIKPACWLMPSFSTPTVTHLCCIRRLAVLGTLAP